MHNLSNKVNLNTSSELNKNKVIRKKFIDSIYESNINKKDYFLISSTIILMLISIFFIIFFNKEIEIWHTKKIQTWWGATFNYLGIILLITKLSFILYLFYLYTKYKAVKDIPSENLPTCTVIVPAYNEGILVFNTLLSLADSDYPTEKLEILAIDDGSKDDTWNWIKEAKLILGDRLSIHKQPKNMGKRHALHWGFTTGKGEIFITVDSDSIVNDKTIRNIVSPFITNDNCGAVAGNVKVLNKKNGIIPKMLNVSFAFSFEFVRSAQSSLGSVLCTPGALAAYKREAVLNCLDSWINQTFLGQPSAIGEDRALTNMILKQGYNVLFQKNAIVYTNTPEKYKNLYKMFIRWERSNVRENIMMSKFAFKNFRTGTKSGTRILLLMQWLNIIVAIPIFISVIIFTFLNPILFIATSFSGILIFSSIQMIFYAKKYKTKEALFAYVYSIFYMFGLFWITPYAIVTARKSGWLTRELTE